MFQGDDGSARGLSVDVLSEAARRAGVALEWIRIAPPRDADSALRDGIVDLWPALTILPAR